jgi:prepilin peptidase CpaA
MVPSPAVVTTVAVSICSLAAAAIDLRTRTVPNVLTGAAAAAGVAMALTGTGQVGIAGAMLGGVVGLTLMLPGYLFGATGGGDVKLLAAVGTFLGPDRVLIAFFGMAIGGGLLALATAVARRSFFNQTFAYAPAIAIGALFAVFK